MPNVRANTINSIKMDVFVNDDGSANVTEVWDANLNNGTEGYKPYFNLNNSVISNFTVTDKTKTYTNLNNWNVNASFNEKAYHSGIHYTNDGLELCWGISNYGNNTYTLKYSISNFVRELSDAQMVYWTLIPYELSAKPKYVYIKIHSNFNYEKTLDVWGYGIKGAPTYVYDGYIEMVAENGLDSDEYMTLLIKYPLNSFKTTNVHSEETFDSYFNQAEEGSEEYINNNGNTPRFFHYVFLSTFVAFILSFCFIFTVAIKQSKYADLSIGFHNIKSKLPKVIPNYRDIPCEKNIYAASLISLIFGLMKKKEDILGVILLKWLKEKSISEVEIESSILHKKNKALKLLKEPTDDAEKELYTMLQEAAKDDILEEKEFTKWCSKNYIEINSFINKVFLNERDHLTEKGLFTKTTKKTLGLFTTNTYEVTEQLKNEAIKLKGLKQFLKEFSNMKEKEPIEVMFWEYYLMYAQIFGIADEVAKQFKKFYPDIANNDYFDSVIFIHNISYLGMNSASEAETRAQSYSSGGGGFSSGGGGGGSFGGGGGGGGFR